MFTAWIRCPLTAESKLYATKRIALSNWTSARVEDLEGRPMRIFRCFEVGYVGCQCTSGKDSSDCCFGQKCTAVSPKCPVCADLGRPAYHRLGTKQCLPLKGKRRRKKVSLSSHTLWSATTTTGFCSQEFINYCDLNGIKHVTTPAYQPASNGQAEFFVKDIKKFIKSSLMTGRNATVSKNKWLQYMFNY